VHTVSLDRLVVLVPVATTVEPECDAGLQKLRAKGARVRLLRGASAIDQARSQMATDALRDGFEHLMWIDADVAFDPADVERLLAHDHPFVCGLIAKKGARALAAHVMPGTTEIRFGEGGGLLEILYAAAAFNLVQARVYHAIRDALALPTCNEAFGAPIVPYYLPMVKDAWYLGEDYAFCERARQAGFAIMADTRVRLGHIGRYAYQWEDAGSELTRYAGFRLTTKG
jgi:hypothetical protein